MLRKLRERARNEQGFTLIELLVAIMIIGILAAIAIVSLLNQRSKGNDIEAKSTALTAARAMETCGTDKKGVYTSCDLTAVRAIEPTLNAAGTRLSVTPAANSYTVAVTANRDFGAASFTLSRSSTGTTTRSCATGSADRGGCSAQVAGSW